MTSNVPKLFAITPIVGGAPDTSPLQQGADYRGFVLADQIGGFGAYLFSGTGPQLVALNALPQVIGLVAVTESGNTRWGELDGNFPNAIRTRLNTWLTARGHPNIPAGWTNRQVVVAVFKRINDNFDLGAMDIAE